VRKSPSRVDKRSIRPAALADQFPDFFFHHEADQLQAGLPNQFAHPLAQPTDHRGHRQHHLHCRIPVFGHQFQLLHRTLRFDLIWFLHSDSLLFSAKKTARSLSKIPSLRVAIFYDLPGIPASSPGSEESHTRAGMVREGRKAGKTVAVFRAGIRALYDVRPEGQHRGRSLGLMVPKSGLNSDGQEDTKMHNVEFETNKPGTGVTPRLMAIRLSRLLVLAAAALPSAVAQQTGDAAGWLQFIGLELQQVRVEMLEQRVAQESDRLGQMERDLAALRLEQKQVSKGRAVP
jgi:hypothetical protein